MPATKKPATKAKLDLAKKSDRDLLWMAVNRRDLKAIAGWLDAGLDPNWSEEGDTLLAKASGISTDRGFDLVELLLERGADPNPGDPPPLFRFPTNRVNSRLLQEGADAKRTWANPGERPRRMDHWYEWEAKREGSTAFESEYEHRVRTLRFWVAKRIPKKRPDASKAFVAFMIRRAERVFGVVPSPASKAKSTAHLATPADMAAWAEENFEAIDWIESGDAWRGENWEWMLTTQRRSKDGPWLDRPLRITMTLPEHPEHTMAAFRAERERAELEVSVPQGRPIRTRRDAIL